LTGETLRFEQILEQLTTIVGKLESGALSLEDSLAQFEEGVRLSKVGAGVLDDAERKIEVLLRDADGSDRTAPLAPMAPLAPVRADDIPF